MYYICIFSGRGKLRRDEENKLHTKGLLSGLGIEPGPSSFEPGVLSIYAFIMWCGFYYKIITRL